MAKRINRISMIVLFFLLSTSSVFAQGAGSEWEVLNRKVRDLYRAGQYDLAVTVAKKAVEVAEKNAGPDHPDVAESLNNLAKLYYSQGQCAKAEPLYKRSLAIREKALGTGHPQVGKSLRKLASAGVTSPSIRIWRMPAADAPHAPEGQ